MNIFSALANGFMGSLGHDAADDAYQQELHAHPNEDVPTHVAHAVGRFFGFIVGGS